MTVESPPVAMEMNPGAVALRREIQGLRQDVRRLFKEMEDVFYLPYLTTQRLAISRIVVMCNTAGTYTVRLGEGAIFAFEPQATSDMLDIPFPRVVNPGQRISIAKDTGADATIGIGLDFQAAWITARSVPYEMPALNEGNLVDG